MYMFENCLTHLMYSIFCISIKLYLINNYLFVKYFRNIFRKNSKIGGKKFVIYMDRIITVRVFL